MTKTILKWIVLMVLSSILGTFFCNIFESLFENVWLARSIGCLVAGITGVVFDNYFIKTPL